MYNPTDLKCVIMFKTLCILFLALFLYTCGSSGETKQTTFNLKINDCTPVLVDHFSICLDSVYNDSRCPEGLECVWEGDAIARFHLKKNSKTIPFELHVNHKFIHDTLIDGVRVKLLGLSPYPIADQPIDARDYVAEIFVERQ